jgi:hypothetical protein
MVESTMTPRGFLLGAKAVFGAGAEQEFIGEEL